MVNLLSMIIQVGQLRMKGKLEFPHNELTYARNCLSKRGEFPFEERRQNSETYANMRNQWRSDCRLEIPWCNRYQQSNIPGKCQSNPVGMDIN